MATTTATKLRHLAVIDGNVNHDWLTEAACRLNTAAPHLIDTIIDEAAHVARIAANTLHATPVPAARYTELAADLEAIDCDQDYRSVRAAALAILRGAHGTVSATA